jgi:hypothetical protein
MTEFIILETLLFITGILLVRLIRDIKETLEWQE